MTACGSCTMCCKLKAVDEIAKPMGRWCTHCDVGRGCRIYDARPKGCRDYECLWLLSQDKPGRQAPADARPDRSKVVLEATTDGEGLVAHVDPGSPHAWREGYAGKVIDRMRRDGFRVIIVCGAKRTAINVRSPGDEAILTETA